MPANTNEFLQRIRTIMPDLRIEHFELNKEGTLNDVVIVNQDLVFRFAKNEAYARTLQTEIRILDYIRPKRDIHVPAPIYTSADCMVYPLLQKDQIEWAEELFNGVLENPDILISRHPSSTETWPPITSCLTNGMEK